MGIFCDRGNMARVRPNAGPPISFKDVYSLPNGDVVRAGYIYYLWNLSLDAVRTSDKRTLG
jgi:hypothetical protein